MAGAGLIEHCAEIGERPGIPAEVTVVTDGVGDSHDRFAPKALPATYHSPTMRQNAASQQSAKVVGRSGSWVLASGLSSEQRGGMALALDLGWGQIDFVGDRPE